MKKCECEEGEKEGEAAWEEEEGEKREKRRKEKKRKKPANATNKIESFLNSIKIVIFHVQGVNWKNMS